MSSKSQKRQRLIAFIFVDTMQYPRTLNNNIYHSNKREPLPFFIWIPILVHSVDKTHFLVVAVELIWLLFLIFFFFFNFFPKPNKSLRFTRFRRSYVNRTTVILNYHCQIIFLKIQWLFLNFLFYLELSVTVLQNCRITAFAEL